MKVKNGPKNFLMREDDNSKSKIRFFKICTGIEVQSVGIKSNFSSPPFTVCGPSP